MNHKRENKIAEKGNSSDENNLDNSSDDDKSSISIDVTNLLISNTNLPYQRNTKDISSSEKNENKS